LTARKTFRWILLLACKLLSGIFGSLGVIYGSLILVHKKYSGQVLGPEYWKSIVGFIVDFGWIPVLIWLILKPLIAFLEKNVCPPYKEKVVTKLVAKLFQGTKPANGHDGNFRVTLYKYRKFSFWVLLSFRWPWGEWLCPYERSGFQRLRSNSRWKVCLNKPSKNEGVAGLCFSQEDPIHLCNLPGREEFKGQGARALKKAYAKQTGITFELLQERIAAEPDYDWPRSFWGIRVICEGKPWGVVLIDSTLPDIGEADYIRNVMTNFLDTIDVILSV